ncbi:MAG: hypothetical protein JWN66_248 [Sphingomonas bacterium]|uniref:hypothetical protein n=1 Tax=Sphingomonas bacterium TaxID=1895847 RepID=UPI00262CDB87|nr:hypothetical protein [Sphingomonas bacterium]MDB5703132.1 hypothetical protein [Sphingomonas bacterium]
MIAAALLILAQSTPDDAMARYREKTAAGPHCTVAADPGEVTVCGRRNADRYRVPLVERDPANPRNEGVPMERERMLARTSNCEEKSIFLIGCGKAGVSVGTGGFHLAGERTLAP